MQSTIYLKRTFLLFLGLLFFSPNGNSKVVYNQITAYQTEAPCPVEKRKAKKKRRKVRKLRKSKKNPQSNLWLGEWFTTLSAVIVALVVVAGAIFFALGPGSILFLVLGITLISIGLTALFLIGILSYREAITGLGIAMSLLIGLFFLIFGLIAGFVGVWILGIVIAGLALLIGFGFIVNGIITGSYG